MRPFRKAVDLLITIPGIQLHDLVGNNVMFRRAAPLRSRGQLVRRLKTTFEFTNRASAVMLAIWRMRCCRSVRTPSGSCSPPSSPNTIRTTGCAILRVVSAPGCSGFLGALGGSPWTENIGTSPSMIAQNRRRSDCFKGTLRFDWKSKWADELQGCRFRVERRR